MFLNEDKKEFHMLTPEQRGIIVEAWLNGQVESYIPAVDGMSSVWLPVTLSILPWHSIYRTKPSKPSINWEHVHPDYKYLVKTFSGDLLLFRTKPTWEYDYWSVRDGLCRYCDHFASVKLGTCKPEDSLVERE